jgi:hypothetical protein
MVTRHTIDRFAWKEARKVSLYVRGGREEELFVGLEAPGVGICLAQDDWFVGGGELTDSENLSLDLTVRRDRSARTGHLEAGRHYGGRRANPLPKGACRDRSDAACQPFVWSG